jgi:hypothetical protein
MSMIYPDGNPSALIDVYWLLIEHRFGKLPAAFDSLAVLNQSLGQIMSLLKDEVLEESFKPWKTMVMNRELDSKKKFDLEDCDILVREMFSPKRDLSWATNR